MLKQHQATISMSRKGNPYDNAACESFMKTLKYEEVYRNEYRDFQDARASIGEFLERVYNRNRLHSALGYIPRPPSRMALPNELGSPSHNTKRGLCPCDPGI
jgi:putative transposase